VSSQVVADVADICDYYVVLRDGRYAFCGPVEELLGAGWQEDPTRASRLESRFLALSGFST
jgi:ABC-type multidrug transport system ATPase subunit